MARKFLLRNGFTEYKKPSSFLRQQRDRKRMVAVDTEGPNKYGNMSIAIVAYNKRPLFKMRKFYQISINLCN